MSSPDPVPPSQPTVAQVKLQRLLATSNPTAIAKRARSTGNTVRLLASGLTRPTTRTVERFVALGILPGDWFVVAESF